jgi:hypothetical protein
VHACMPTCMHGHTHAHESKQTAHWYINPLYIVLHVQKGTFNNGHLSTGVCTVYLRFDMGMRIKTSSSVLEVFTTRNRALPHAKARLYNAPVFWPRTGKWWYDLTLIFVHQHQCMLCTALSTTPPLFLQKYVHTHTNRCMMYVYTRKIRNFKYIYACMHTYIQSLQQSSLHQLPKQLHSLW